MSTKELKVNYKKLLNKAEQANGRKETVSYLNRAAKLKTRIYSKQSQLHQMQWSWVLRISLDGAKTCLCCLEGVFN